MPVITLPDGSQKTFDRPVTVDEVAASIGAGLRKAALAGRVNGKLVDTSFSIAQDAQLQIITDKSAEALEIIRHSTAHLLAQAVQSLFPDAQVTIGPVTSKTASITTSPTSARSRRKTSSPSKRRWPRSSKPICP